MKTNCPYCEGLYVEREVFVGLSHKKRPKYEKRKFLEKQELGDGVEITDDGFLLMPYQTEYDGRTYDLETKIEINFCPICGKKIIKTNLN